MFDTTSQQPHAGTTKMQLRNIAPDFPEVARGAMKRGRQNFEINIFILYHTSAKLASGGGKKIGVQKPIRKTKKSGDLFLLVFENHGSLERWISYL